MTFKIYVRMMFLLIINTFWYFKIIISLCFIKDIFMTLNNRDKAARKRVEFFYLNDIFI